LNLNLIKPMFLLAANFTAQKISGFGLGPAPKMWRETQG